MITVRLTVISYDKDKNICKAKLLNGDVIAFDPYVGCAIELSDKDYFAGKGGDIVGNTYVMTEYYVYNHVVVPREDGLILLTNGDKTK